MDYWSGDRLAKAMLATPDIIREAAQASRVAEILPKWRDVPLYHAALAGESPGHEGAPAGLRLGSLPVITKRDILAGFPANFLGDQSLDTVLGSGTVELDYTSGTSEEQLPVLSERRWWARQEKAALRLNRLVAGLLDEHPNARRATLTTPVCNGRVCDSPWRPQAHRVDGLTLYVNVARIPFLLTTADLDRMAAEVREWEPLFLDVDPVHAVRFALHCERHGINFPTLKFVLSSYEFTSVVHRRVLERLFGVPVFNLYGSTETGHLLMESEEGEMKPSLDTAFLEVIDTDANGVGELAVTTLSNDYMPLLRYRIGDLVERRTSPYATSYVVHGRARDALRAADDRRVTTWQVDQCFTEITGIAHYQLRQNEDGSCLLRFIPDGDGPSTADLKKTIARLGELLGCPGRIAFEAVDLLLPAPSGKFRLTTGV